MRNPFKKPSLEFMQIPSCIKWPKKDFVPKGYKEDKELEAMVRIDKDTFIDKSGYEYSFSEKTISITSPN